MLDFIKYNELTYQILRWWYGLENNSVRSYVFVCSTGRCGTNTISDVFSKAQEVRSLHEPYPTMYANQSDLPLKHQQRLSLQKRKHLNILKASRKKFAYIESNHMFIKTFFDVAYNLLPLDKIKLIHVSRDPFSVASSFYSIDSIPGKPPTGDRFLLDPFGPGNLIDLSKELNSDVYSHDFFKCLWYWYEVEERIAEAKKRTSKRVEWLELKTKDLNSSEKIKELVSFVGLSDTIKKTDELVGVRSNQKKPQKSLISEDEFKVYERKFNQLLLNKGFQPYSGL